MNQTERDFETVAKELRQYQDAIDKLHWTNEERVRPAFDALDRIVAENQRLREQVERAEDLVRTENAALREQVAERDLYLADAMGESAKPFYDVRAERDSLRRERDDLAGRIGGPRVDLMAEIRSLRAELADLWNLSRRIVIRYRKALLDIAAMDEPFAAPVAQRAISGEYDPRFEEGAPEPDSIAEHEAKSNTVNPARSPRISDVRWHGAPEESDEP